MLGVAEILVSLTAVLLRWLRLSVRSSRSIRAENLFLRRQLALYLERGVKPRRIESLGPGIPDSSPITKMLPQPSSPHRRGEAYAVRATSILDGLHHEYSLAPPN